MPLDPFFAERLRVHRRYLLGRAWSDLRARVRVAWRFGREDAATPAVSSAPAAASAARGEASAPTLSRPAQLRATHRRAALAWDRTEQKTVGLPGPPLRITEHTVAVDGAPDVRVRIYHPDATGPVPACLTFFGGAFRIGGIDYPTTDAACRRRAASAGVAMVAVEYALAPEHRYPVAVEQAHAALLWLHREAETLGVDRERLGVAGTSAGAAIAAALTLVNRDRERLPLRLQVLEVPVTDLTGRHLDLRPTWALGIPSLIALRELRSIARTYLARPEQAREQLASPLRAASHADLPSAVILTAEYDPLRGDGAAYAAALRRAGVEASAVRYLGVTHDIPIFVGALEAARRWEDDVVRALRRLHV
ncbi:alpha/beta hydrolase fold domain-containing protein [Microbacterium fluvii]|uniref:Alpha/beta hydrolase fold domain-containing protein n=1 Tax=Microbacterium fluvii TaxID=415215 RepID=A0ABW2HF41_9MICO|nr:alpha/beta hydrolase [Microbacterium fluvii]MCU4672695.1 alpha/beta hydrolase [Microbacterium fluvii]